MNRFFDLFGFSGTLSVLFCVCVWLLLFVGLRTGKLRFTLLAVLCAVVSLTAATVNSVKISGYRTAPSEEAEEEVSASRLPAQARLRSEQLFVEESLEDVAMLQRAQKVAEDKLATYRPDAPVERNVSDGEAMKVSVETEFQTVRYLPAVEVTLANRWDALNLAVVRLGLWLSIFSVPGILVWNFRGTRMQPLPLPLAGTFLDFGSRRRSGVRFFDLSNGRVDLSAFLEYLIQRGETFVCFAELPGAEKCFRLQIGPLALWPFPVETMEIPVSIREKEFVFDAAWFHRSATVITQPGAFRELLAFFTPLLRGRLRLHAVSRKTVLIVLPSAAAENEEVREFLRWSNDANFRFVFYGHHAPALSPGISCDAIQTVNLLSPVLKCQWNTILNKLRNLAQGKRSASDAN